VLDGEFAAVVAAAASGKEAAFARLWRDAHPPLLRYLRVLSVDAAEDVASEVWLEVARGMSGFQGDESAFRGWLFTLARRRCVDNWRRVARAPVRLTADHAELDASMPDSAAMGAAERLSTEWALRLIARLPREQAEAIVLRVVAGLEVAQVARILGKSPGAVRVAAHRGLRTLSGMLADAPAVRERALA
jgi:RNA polymerase sigma-70 factor, ECF subfamily